MFDKIRNWNRKNIKNCRNLLEYDDYNNLKNKKKLKKNVVGIDIKAEFPKKPDIVINNDFNKNIKHISNELLKKIIKII